MVHKVLKQHIFILVQLNISARAVLIDSSANDMRAYNVKIMLF